jgi:hypothetical protein
MVKQCQRWEDVTTEEKYKRCYLGGLNVEEEGHKERNVGGL